MSDKVTLTLAHPLTAKQAERLHIEGGGKDLVQGDSITLPREDARAVINAGYAAGVEPENHDAVRKALGETTKTTKTSSAAKPSS